MGSIGVMNRCVELHSPNIVPFIRVHPLESHSGNCNLHYVSVTILSDHNALCKNKRCLCLIKPLVKMIENIKEGGDH